MGVLEADHVDSGATMAGAGPIRAKRASRALSLRERRGVLAAADLILGAASTFLAYLLHRGHLHTLPVFEPLYFGAVWVIALLMVDGYGLQVPSSRVHSSTAVLKALPLALLLAVLDFFFRPYVLNRTIIVLALAIGAALMILMRTTAARLLLHEGLAVRAVLLTDGTPRDELVSLLYEARYEYQVKATLNTAQDAGAADADMVAEVSRLLRECSAHELIVGGDQLRLLPGLAEECLTQGVRVVSGANLVERYTGRVPIDSVDVHWYLGLPDNDMLGRPYAIARRAADVFLCTVFGLPFLILFPFLALLIRLDSSGPVLLFQRRVGELGEQFEMVKLRTMVSDAEAKGARYTHAADTRITRVGAFLRATRLDEFPQLLNIARGEMSFIGPRPERPEFVGELEKQIPHFRARLLVKPGLTGWAQIRGGYASTILSHTTKLEHDLYYIKNRSLRLDLQILGSTFVTVLRRRGR